MKVFIYVTLKQGVLDPQGAAIQKALHSLEYPSVQSVRQGKFFELKLNVQSKEEAQRQVKEMCEKLLANTVIEDYRFEVTGSQ